MEKKFKFLSHTADVKFRAYGKTLNSAFENSAIAMFKSMYAGEIKSARKHKIKVKGKDLESLLYNFLEELLILVDSKGFFISKLKARIDNKRFVLEGIIYGDDAKNYDIGIAVKAVTYNNMFVRKIKDKWVCQVVLDV